MMRLVYAEDDPRNLPKRLPRYPRPSYEDVKPYIISARPMNAIMLEGAERGLQIGQILDAYFAFTKTPFGLMELQARYAHAFVIEDVGGHGAALWNEMVKKIFQGLEN